MQNFVDDSKHKQILYYNRKSKIPTLYSEDKKPWVIKMNTQTKITEYASNEGLADELANFFEEVEEFGNSRMYRYDYGFRFYVRKEGF